MLCCMPTKMHKFIRCLRDSGRLVRHYTQNIDTLDAQVGLLTDISKDTVESVRLHGCLDELECSKCHMAWKWVAKSLNSACLSCEELAQTRKDGRLRPSQVGYLRPNIRRYNEFDHPDADRIEELQRQDILSSPDLLLVCGTSLKVDGFTKMVRTFAKYVRSSGGLVILVNRRSLGRQWRKVFNYWVDSDCDIWANTLMESPAFTSTTIPTRLSTTRTMVASIDNGLASDGKLLRQNETPTENHDDDSELARSKPSTVSLKRYIDDETATLSCKRRIAESFNLGLNTGADGRTRLDLS
jgi:NAD-dependent histone deacetylase SIR2